MTSPGGGGIGDPAADGTGTALASRDVDNQLISPDRAARVYGYEERLRIRQ